MPILTPFRVAQTETADFAPFLSGWWVIVITAITTIPWGIIAVWDAIDTTYRNRRKVAARLLLSSACLLLAYFSGLAFVIGLIIIAVRDEAEGRFDEIATVLVLLAFNLWHVGRNARGWLQFYAIHKLRPVFGRVGLNFRDSFPEELGKGFVWMHGLQRLQISSGLFDNEISGVAPYLSPFYHMRADAKRDKTYEAWAIAMWRAWWTQDVYVDGVLVKGLEQVAGLRVGREYRCLLAHKLKETKPAWPKGADVLICDTGPDGEVCIPVGSVFDTSGAPIEDKDRWAECLETYGWVENEEPQGQQDTTGPELPPVISLASPSAIPILIYEKTQHPPNRMCALWYATDRFETLYESLVVEMASVHPDVLFPTWASWLRLAQDVGIHLERPIFLSDDRLVDYAGELASASVILVHFHTRYADLVDQIYSDGMNARWTFGWSGLLSCFTHLWTRDRIYIAMLNGLSLLCLTYDKHTDITQLPADIRSMLYGYAAFAVQDRAVGKKVANDRKAELLKRYKHNKGKTCRGSGLCATRSACRKLELPEEASHMDGLPSFATGWCMEYLSDLPGNQPPMYGGNHDEVEALQGSSNAWRYPYSHG